MGFGPQADRKILEQNVSGLFFYALICGGIISLLSISYIIISILVRLIKLTLINKIYLYSNNMYLGLSILFIGLLFVRAIGEVTFGIFGIDMILFFASYNIISKYKNSIEGS